MFDAKLCAHICQMLSKNRIDLVILDQRYFAKDFRREYEMWLDVLFWLTFHFFWLFSWKCCMTTCEFGNSRTNWLWNGFEDSGHFFYKKIEVKRKQLDSWKMSMFQIWEINRNDGKFETHNQAIDFVLNWQQKLIRLTNPLLMNKIVYTLKLLIFICKLSHIGKLFVCFFFGFVFVIFFFCHLWNSWSFSIHITLPELVHTIEHIYNRYFLYIFQFLSPGRLWLCLWLHSRVSFYLCTCFYLLAENSFIHFGISIALMISQHTFFIVILLICHLFSILTFLVCFWVCVWVFLFLFSVFCVFVGFDCLYKRNFISVI